MAPKANTNTKKQTKTATAKPEVVVATPAVVAEPVVVVAEPLAVVATPAVVVATEATPAQDGGKKAPKVKAAPKAKAPVAKKAPVLKASKKAATPKVATKKASAKKVADKKAPAPKVAKEAKPAKVVADGAVDGAENEDEDDKKSRYFKLVFNGVVSGRFSGNKPKQAANKAFTAIIKSNTKEGGAESNENKFTFKIKECTRGSKQKEYRYTGERIKLDVPMVVKIGQGADAKEIIYKFTNKVKKLKDEIVAPVVAVAAN